MVFHSATISSGVGDLNIQFFGDGEKVNTQVTVSNKNSIVELYWPLPRALHFLICRDRILHLLHSLSPNRLKLYQLFVGHSILSADIINFPW
jgi:hypothetical protein